MLVISDTSPLRYLIEIGLIGILPEMFTQIVTTPDVMRELQMAHFPVEVRSWARTPPPWIQIAGPTYTDFLDKVDLGEATAISLARERHADYLLIDERAGVRIANSIGLKTVGTLSILVAGGVKGLFSFDDAL